VRWPTQDHPVPESNALPGLRPRVSRFGTSVPVTEVPKLLRQAVQDRRSYERQAVSSVPPEDLDPGHDIPVEHGVLELGVATELGEVVVAMLSPLLFS
jgi:hypothetical protein